MKHWFKILMGLFTIGCNSHTTILTESEFTKVYIDSLKQVYPNRDLLFVTGNKNETEIERFKSVAV